MGKKETKEPIEYEYNDTGYDHLFYEYYTPTYKFKLDYTFIPKYEEYEFEEVTN